MKLFTKEINNKLFAQYPKGNDLDSQLVVTKIFNPYGKGRWFLLNSDPQDPDYLWAIVQMGDIVEVGSVLRSELESLRVSPYKFPLERDLGFRMVNAGELYRGLQQGKFYNKGGTLSAASGMEVGRYYKDKNGNSFRYIGENMQGDTLFNDGERVIVKSRNDFEEEPNKKSRFSFFKKGGKTEQGVDLFEDYENIPDNVQLILEKYEDVFMDGDYKGLAKAQKELNEIGYTFDSYLDGQAYDLRKIGQKGKNEDDYADGGKIKNDVTDNIRYKGTRFEENLGYKLTDEKWHEVDKKGRLAENDLGGVDDWRHAINEKWGYEKFKVLMYSPKLDKFRNTNPNEFYNNKGYADGGFVDKTDEELKGMNDDELFAYLDAKAAYMKQYARPLSSFKAKNFAANAAAVQFQNEGTAKLDANFPNLSKINQQATKDYEETIAKRNKMGSGGKIDKKIVVELYGGKKEYYDNDEIQDMINRYEDFVGADNLPKWMYMSAMRRGNFEGIASNSKKAKIKESTINVLQKILDSNGDVYINVRSDKPETNEIVYNTKMSGGGFTSSFSGTPDRRRVTKEKGGYMAKGGELNKIKYETKIKSKSDDGKYYEKEIYANGILIAEMSARSERYSIPANLNYTNAIRTAHDFKIKQQGIKSLLGEEIFKNIKFNSSYISYNNKIFYISNNYKLSIKILKDAINYANEDKMADGGEMALGGKLKDLLSRAKTATKKGYDKSKEYTKKQIHDQKKKIALDVIDETIYNYRNDENEFRQHLAAAEELIEEGYAKGGEIPDVIKRLISDMQDRNVARKTVKVKKGSDGHLKFMKDVQPAIDKKILIVRHNPIDDNEMFISLTPNHLNKMDMGGKLKVNGDDFSFLLDLNDKELSKRLYLIRKQQDINGKQYFEAKEKNQSTKKIEDSRKNLDNQERAIIEARSRKMAMGGKVKFEDKVKAIKASLLKTKKVPTKVQKDYGKTYNAKEAEQAAKRIAGAMRKKEMK